MKADVFVVGKHEFNRKDGKTAYVLELVDFDRKSVYKAFTSKKHYDAIEESVIDNLLSEIELYSGYITFENGFTKFYLPKDEVK